MKIKSDIIKQHGLTETEFTEICKLLKRKPNLSKFNTLDLILASLKNIIKGFQTCFTESMFAGIPTILLLTKENWECKAIYDDLFLELERAKILHFNPVEAASHVKEIYSDPMLWWQSEKVLLARKKF